MLEYFTYKKIKKHREQKKATGNDENDEAGPPAGSARVEDAILDPGKEGDAGHRRHSKQGHDKKDGIGAVGGLHDKLLREGQTAPVLQSEDVSFLEELLSQDGGDAPPLPPRNYSVSEWEWPSDNPSDVGSDSDAASTKESKENTVVDDAKGKKKDGKKPNRLAVLFSRHKKTDQGLEPDDGVPKAEGEREKQDLSRVLDRLNLSAKNNMVISTDNSEILQRFTQVFKDLVNGVPTAYDDLTKLIEDRDGTLSKGFDKLPSSLKKLVTQLPEKITGSLGPEILAAAAASQGVKADSSGGMKSTAKKILLPNNIAELVTKPGAIVGMFRAIVEVLKARWPAFIGMNVVWSVALSLLLFVLWYCYKRGREERIEREKSASAIDGSDRIEELPDDPALPAPEPPAEGAEATATGDESRQDGDGPKTTGS
ncbi:hypothetical protein RJ55_08009 [Drechmeria coniospora]|nr:hypothetical protein RJ55_08009 [Drechmeria coniospora]